MRINNNLMAMNTHRQYAVNNNNVAKNVEKLSSGYRINRAGDDAAGLAISEKMRAQIRGLGMASKNSQDGISLIQTAEGALQESHNILQRMRELAVQSASDTNETTIDRDALNKEFQAMLEEIDDTAQKTKFNDLGLINGDFAKYKVEGNADGSSIYVPATAIIAPAKLYADALAHGAKGPGMVTFSIQSITDPGVTTPAAPAVPGVPGGAPLNNLTAFGLNNIAVPAFARDTTAAANDSTLNGLWTFARSADGKWTATNGENGRVITGSEAFDSAGGGALDAMLIGDKVDVTFVGLGKVTFTASGNSADFAGAISVTGDISISGAKFPIPEIPEIKAGSAPVVTYTYTDMNGVPKSVSVSVFAGQTRMQLENGVSIDFGTAIDADFGNLADVFAATFPIDISVNIEETGVEFIVQTGANKGDELQLNIDKMDAKTLGIFGADIAQRENSSWAIQHVNNAINTVSTQRAALGAMQNRMEHKIANLDTSAENLQAAEARIRDLDMAKEMTTFTKNNILSQASTAMLAQANSLPQGVLQLLQ